MVSMYTVEASRSSQKAATPVQELEPGQEPTDDELPPPPKKITPLEESSRLS